MRTTARTMRTAAVLVGLLTAAGAGAHGGEDHGEEKTQAGGAAAPQLGRSATTPMAGTSAQRLPDGSLFIPKSVQHELGVRTVVARLAEVAATVELNGRVIADPNSGGRVQATQSGRIEPGPGGLPGLGQPVRRGQVLAYLRPAASAIERGNQQAQLAELEAQLELARARLVRYGQLEGAIPGKELDAARIEVTALARRSRAVGASLSKLEALVAPADGVVSVVSVVAGQVVDAKDTVFEIVDPGRLAVEALAYDIGLATGIASASARASEGNFALRFVGAGRQLREQALPLVFRIATPGVALAVGQPVKVIVKTQRTVKAAVVPQVALVRNANGDTVAWLHTSAERFLARRVRFQPLDGVSAAVGTGLTDGDRVVTEAAGLLNQVR